MKHLNRFYFLVFASLLSSLFFVGANLPRADAASLGFLSADCWSIRSSCTSADVKGFEGSALYGLFNSSPQSAKTFYFNVPVFPSGVSIPATVKLYDVNASLRATVSVVNHGTYGEVDVPANVWENCPSNSEYCFPYYVDFTGYSYYGQGTSYSDMEVFDAPPGPPPPTVSMAYPGNGSTTPDFSNWVVNWGGTPPYGNMTVYYGFSTSSWSYSDSVNFSPYVNVSPLGIPKHQALWFVPLAVPAQWYAQAVDVGATSTVTSTIISFYVDPNAAAPPSSTSTIIAAPFYPTASTTIAAISSCSTLTSTDPFGIEMGLCNAISFLFVPSPDQQANLGVLFNGIKTTYGAKPPFGYLSSIVTPLQNFNVSSSLSWPKLTDASTTAAFSPVYGIFDAGFAAIVYVLLGFWVFHRARKIEL